MSLINSYMDFVRKKLFSEQIHKISHLNIYRSVKTSIAAGHSMQVKERHYEKVREDFEQVHESHKNYHSTFVEG